MGTSRSGSVGLSTRWKVTSDQLRALASAVLTGSPRSIPQGAGGPTEPRSIRALGKQLAAAGYADKRFSPQVGDFAVKVAIETLIPLVTAARVQYRTQRDTDELLAEYGISSAARNVVTALAKVLDQRYREALVKQRKKSTDSAEKARQAMQRTLVDILSPDRSASAFSKLTADAIHTALRRTNSMKIVERFYANYLYNTMAQLVSSIHADLSRAAEKNVLDGLRVTYCDYVAKEVVKRAGQKGWLASEIPDKADDWADLLVGAEEVHA